jgi:hemerythrin-like domain-containing protein
MTLSIERCLGCSTLQRREEGRSHLAAMEAAIEPASAGDTTALKQFTEHARAYIELLLEYIAKQEDCLFPMIIRALSESDRARLTRALDTGCGDGEGERVCDDYVDLANRLAEHFDVPRAATADSPGNWGVNQDTDLSRSPLLST